VVAAKRFVCKRRGVQFKLKKIRRLITLEAADLF
jgi:hypothetical protein